VALGGDGDAEFRAECSERNEPDKLLHRGCGHSLPFKAPSQRYRAGRNVGLK